MPTSPRKAQEEKGSAVARRALFSIPIVVILSAAKDLNRSDLL
jgi:hypothetical protein